MCRDVGKKKGDGLLGNKQEVKVAKWLHWWLVLRIYPINRSAECDTARCNQCAKIFHTGQGVGPALVSDKTN